MALHVVAAAFLALASRSLAALDHVSDNEVTPDWALFKAASVNASPYRSSEDSGLHEAFLALMQIGSERHLQTLQARMTTPQALRMLPSAPAGLHELLANSFGTSDRSAFLQVRTRKQTTQGRSAKTVDQAREMLNTMIEASHKKVDIRKVNCSETAERNAAMIEDARRDIAEYNEQGAATRARVVTIQTGISTMEEKLPRLNEAEHLHSSKCEADIVGLRNQIHVVGNDTTTIDNVVKLTSCGSAAASFLLKCSKGKKGESFVTFSHHIARRKVAQLRSDIAKSTMQQALKKVVSGVYCPRHARKACRAGRNSRVQQRQVQRRERQQKHHRKAHRKHRGPGNSQAVGYSLVQTDSEDGYGPPPPPEWSYAIGPPPPAGHPNHDWPPPMSDVPNYRDMKSHMRHAENHCSVRTNPDCNYLRDKFLFMQTGIADKTDAMKETLVKTESLCGETRKNYQAQAEQLQNRLKDQQAALAEATRAMIEAESQSRLIGEQLEELQHEGWRTAGQCDADLTGIASEICGVKQIRQELYKLSSTPKFIQDCETSPWIPEECSMTCGGGTQTLTRSVVVPASFGAACPALTMQRNCNEMACPVDCHMDAWGGWSQCSAAGGCGGGIKERVREIKQQSQFGGQPCGSTSESESCMEQACDEDCILAPWSSWSNCSKACDHGLKMRHRSVEVYQRGQGTCGSTQSDARLQYQQCNDAICAPASGDLLTCTSKVDVVLILDGSGSVTDAGWAKLLEASGKLIRSFTGGDDAAQAAVLLFSGPTDYAKVQQCTNGDAGIDLEADCKIKWVSHFSTNMDTLATTVEALTWPKGGSLTSMALASAEAELQTGRSDAQQVVLVVTDGAPHSEHKTTAAAARLKRKARLIWVPVRYHAPLSKLQAWASLPARDNVLVVPEFDRLPEPGTLNNIIADVCQNVT